MSPFKVSVGGVLGSPAPSNTLQLVTQLMQTGPGFFFFVVVFLSFSECRLSQALDTEVILSGFFFLGGGMSCAENLLVSCCYFDDWTLSDGS